MTVATEPFVLPPQPLLGTDVGAFVLLALAALYMALWWRDREPGMSWLAGAFGVLGIFWASTRWHLPTSPYVSSQHVLALIPLGLALLQIGLVNYLGISSRTLRVVLPLLLVFPLASLVLIGLSLAVPIERGTSNIALTLGLIGLAALALWQARREPDAGHGFVGLTLLSIPAVSITTVLLGADPVLTRFLAPLPLVFFGMTLLPVSLLRRRRALEAEVARRADAEAALVVLNTSLEEQVRRRTADLQEMVVGLESFNRSVSHDLRGPLGGMAQLADLAEQALLRGDLQAAARMLPTIRRQSEDSARLVDALLALARVGDAPMQRQRVNLGEMAREVEQALRAARGEAVSAQVVLAALPVVDADPALLRAVLTNLIGNALKFSERRAEGRVSVYAETGAEGVTVHVTDNGEGFDAASAALLFQPFQRLHGAAYEGHGVGLSIVRRAVERHGGRVWAQGQPGGGATFSFSLPQAAPLP